MSKRIIKPDSYGYQCTKCNVNFLISKAFVKGDEVLCSTCREGQRFSLCCPECGNVGNADVCLNCGALASECTGQPKFILCIKCEGYGCAFCNDKGATSSLDPKFLRSC